MNAAALAEEARLFPLRDAYLYNILGQQQAVESNWTAPNPPYGAVFTYHVAQAQPPDTRLVLTITDLEGRTIRQMDGRDPANTIPRNRVCTVCLESARGCPTSTPQAEGAAAGRGGAGFGGRGAAQGPVVEPGRYRATLGKKVADKITGIGPQQTFAVVKIQ